VLVRKVSGSPVTGSGTIFFSDGQVRPICANAADAAHNMMAVILIFLECIYNSLDCGWRSAFSISANHLAIFATGAADVKAKATGGSTG
jgi:hypothetical protein